MTEGAAAYHHPENLAGESTFETRSSSADGEATASRALNAFCRLPNAVARDKRLSESTLVMLAYRATFIGPFALSVTGLLREPIVRGDGLGRDVIERGIKQYCDAGYAKRWQPPSRGDRSFERCLEILTLPPCGADGKAGRIIRRKWWDGRLSVQEMAAYLYLRAGTGKGAGTFAREFADRFAWSRTTAAKAIKALIAFGLVAKRERRAHGRVQAVTYEALEPVLWQTQPLSKNQGTRHQGTRTQGTYISDPLHILEEPLSHTPCSTEQGGRYAPRAAHEEATPSDHDTLRDQAFASTALLSWIGVDGLVEMGGIDPADLAAVAAVVSDGQLREFLRAATGGRVAKEILRPAGLFAIRWLATALLEDDPTGEPRTPAEAAEALVGVLNAIWDRIGSRPGSWLNSLALIGKRMAAEGYVTGDTRFYAADGEPMFHPKPSPDAWQQPAEDAPDPSLQALLDADGARTLAPKLRRDPGGLRVFLQKHGGAQALDIMVSVLCRHMIDGKPISSVRSWRFFEAAIAEEMHRSDISAMGIRPGDVFGAHKWKNANG